MNLLSLAQISQSESLRDLLPVDQVQFVLSGQKLLQSGILRGYELRRDSKQCAQIKFYFYDSESGINVEIFIFEQSPQGVLTYEGELSVFVGATLTLLWWALLGDSTFLRHLESEVVHFCQDFIEFQSQSGSSKIRESEGPQKLSQIQFESVSLVFSERNLVQGRPGLDHFMQELETPFELIQAPGLEDPRNAAVFNLPNVFKKSVSAGSSTYVVDVKRQLEIASRIRYNFSNGQQLSAADLLRHEYKILVPRDLWPQPALEVRPKFKWPLLQSEKHLFVSRDLEEVEQIIQELLEKISLRLHKKTLKVFLQADFLMSRVLPIHEINFEAPSVFEWSVEFTRQAGHFELKPRIQEQHFEFFESFALDPARQVLVAFGFWQEFQDIRKLFIGRPDFLKDQNYFALSLMKYPDQKKFLSFLRARALPFEIAGGTHHLDEKQSLLKFSLNEDAHYSIERVFKFGKSENHQPSLSDSTALLLRALEDHAALFLQVDLRDYVATAGKKRDWDLKLLKHTGVLQYLTLETLMFHFQGQLLENIPCEKDTILEALFEKLHALIVVGEGTLLERKMALPDLVSKSALVLLQEFIKKIQRLMEVPEPVYTPDGELLYHGTFEREMRWLFEVLKHMAFSTSGAIFKRSRTGLLSKIYTGRPEVDELLQEGQFLMPGPAKGTVQLTSAIGLLQPLIPFGAKIYLNDQSLVELSEDDFKVDFEVKTRAESGDINWFDLNPRFFLQGLEVNPQSFKNFGQGGGVIQFEGKYYLIPQKQLPSLKRLESFWFNLQQGQEKTKKTGWSDKVYQIPKNKTLELLALRASGYNVHGDDDWKKLCEFYDRLGSPELRIQRPETVKADLKPYQLTGLQWLNDLYELRLGALLADDMGLGKTLQALAFLEHLRISKKMGAVLVVVPSSLVYNWQSEIEKFVPSLQTVIFTSKDQDLVGKKLEAKEDLVVITTYGLLIENAEFLAQYQWNVLIFDEAQNLKNITTRRTTMARQLNARFKLCLTGTPMENHYGEYYSLVDLVVPGSLGKYEDFRRSYVNQERIEREEIADLKLRTKPLVLRRTKKEILDQLPEKQETKVSIAFDEDQKAIYRDIALSYNQKIHDALQTQTEGQVQLQMLTALLRLRQACSDPSGLPMVKYNKVPPKLEALLDSLREIVDSGESALVFTQFLQTLGHLEKLLKEAGIPVFVLHGSVSTKQRQELLRQFNETQGGAVLVMTLKTGGVGLNLTKASYVFHLEPWWNPAVENQATDRAHRLGQTRAVQVFRYIMHESLEEKMEILKARKNLKFGHLFSDTEEATFNSLEGSSSLSREDFEFLLR